MKDVLNPTRDELRNRQEADGDPLAVARRRIYEPWRRFELWQDQDSNVVVCEEPAVQNYSSSPMSCRLQ